MESLKMKNGKYQNIVIDNSTFIQTDKKGFLILWFQVEPHQWEQRAMLKWEGDIKASTYAEMIASLKKIAKQTCPARPALMTIKEMELRNELLEFVKPDLI